MAGKISCPEKPSNGKSLLFAVLSWCFLLTGAQSVTTTTISVDPSKPIEGGDVSLTPASVPASTTSCRWFRGGDTVENTILVYYFFPSPPTQRPGASYTGRETMDSTCSLHITNLAGNYSGTYLFLAESHDATIKGEVDIVVSEKPSGTVAIMVDPPKPFEGGNIQLKPAVVPVNTVLCHWFRGGNAPANTILVYYFCPSPTQRPGANYTGRETMDSDCNLHITNLAGNYSGTYMFLLEFIGGYLKGEVELIVSEDPSGTVAIMVDPPKPFEGGNVQLKPATVPENTVLCRWFQGGDALANTILVYYFFPSPTQRPGANYTGRETMDSDCSLHITNLAGNYSGTYMLTMESLGAIVTGKVDLLVSD